MMDFRVVDFKPVPSEGDRFPVDAQGNVAEM
jgi:hypothetical protein